MNDTKWLKNAELFARRLAEKQFDKDIIDIQLIYVVKLTI